MRQDFVRVSLKHTVAVPMYSSDGFTHKRHFKQESEIVKKITKDEDRVEIKITDGEYTFTLEVPKENVAGVLL